MQLYDYIRAEIGERVVDRIFDLTKEVKVAAEIGCNRGFISRHDLSDTIEHLYLCDSNATLLKQAEEASKPNSCKISTILMDEETPQVILYTILKVKLKSTNVFLLISHSLKKTPWIWWYRI